VVLTEAVATPRSAGALLALGIAAVLAFAILVGLGVWQVHRLAWKRDLIARVDARVHAPAAPAPQPAEWPQVTATKDEYRHVRVTGSFLNDRETLVQAVTELGAGSWVLTPLKADDGAIYLVNRGFVPPDRRSPASRPDGQIAGETAVTGLLRLSEPGGAFLRRNDPAGERWFSRDVVAIAAARGLDDVAPFFIDADATRVPGGYPVGGLTVISFPNNHLVYAITWFGLATMLVGGAVIVGRDEWRLRRLRMAAETAA
jgi:surfeit locus 1 family protein